MRFRPGVPLLLATLTALLLGLVGGQAPGALAARPTDTRVAGIDVDAATIPELQDLMDRHRLSASSSCGSTSTGSRS